MKLLKINLSKDIEGQKQLVSLPKWNLVQVKMHNSAGAYIEPRAGRISDEIFIKTVPIQFYKGNLQGTHGTIKVKRRKGVPYLYYTAEVVVLLTPVGRE